MRVGMSLFQNEHSVWCVRKKVPKALEQAVATVLGNGKKRQPWLQRSLRTKNKQEAKRLAPPVLMEFNRIFADAEASTAERPLRTTLDRREIERIADFFYAHELAADEEKRREGGSEALFQSVAKQLSDAGVHFDMPYSIGSVPEFGLSDREMDKINQSIEIVLPAAQQWLARGDISKMRWEIDELLKLFRINLDRSSAAYRELGIEILKRFVKAQQAIERRQKGEVVETPELIESSEVVSPLSGSLRAAHEGWKKSRNPSPTTLREFTYAIDRFVELHGDMPVAKITRRHVLHFREALQDVPIRRSGKLRNAPLPELVEWSKHHPRAPRVSNPTVNKLLGGMQAVALCARDNGLIADDAPWADPFANMRLSEDPSTREPWQLEELRLLFTSAVFTEGARPTAGRGEAAFWLPLLGLFTGARLGELAPLTAADVTTEEPSQVTMITIREDPEQGRRLKTAGSARVVPVHPELVRIGFLRFVEDARSKGGASARLFPLLTPGPRGGFGEAWSKWFGRYIRDLGIHNRASVFHSFRHGFKDALRAAEVSEDVNDALTGHAGPGTIGRQYGARQMIRRFGITTLAAAVAKVTYSGLDLSHLPSLRSKNPSRKLSKPPEKPKREIGDTKEPPASGAA
jgi:integrase